MGYTILVVDDSPLIREMLKDYLEGHDCRVLEAQDGAAAFAIIQKDPPDLVVMDLDMPNVPGVPATHVLQGLVSTADIPVIVFTGKEERTAAQALSFGPKLRYVCKASGVGKVWETASQMLSGASPASPKPQ